MTDLDAMFGGCDDDAVYALAFGWLEAMCNVLDPTDPVVARARACVAAARRRLDQLAAARKGSQR